MSRHTTKAVRPPEPKWDIVLPIVAEVPKYTNGYPLVSMPVTGIAAELNCCMFKRDVDLSTHVDKETLAGVAVPFLRARVCEECGM